MVRHLSSSACALLLVVVVGCAGSTSNDDHDGTPSAASDLTAAAGTAKLVFGEDSPVKKATGGVTKYTFDLGANAAVRIDVNEAFVPGEPALVDPPRDVALTGPTGALVDAQTTVFPGGGQANAGVGVRASNLAAGTYTISYTGIVPHSYFVHLDGHNGTGLNAPCDVSKGVRHNATCGDALRCSDSDSICEKPANKGGFCNTRKNGDDVCGDGQTCQFDKATSQGDEGFNGLCR